jgi:rare lipoprotein A
MKLLAQVFTLLLLTTQLAFAGQIDKGLASYYADKFQGRKTSNGERYDKNKLTAAHRTLPFGTKVKVTNVKTRKSVIVRINDRGPFIKGRIIDVSRKAAKDLGMLKTGVIQVEVRILSSKTPPVKAKGSTAKKSTKKTKRKITSRKIISKKNPNLVAAAKDMKTGGLYKMQVLRMPAKGFGVQVAGYSDYQSVVQQLAVFQENWFKGATIFVDEMNGKPYYKIILGPLPSKTSAQSYCNNIKKKYKIKDAFVVDISKMAAKR